MVVSSYTASCRYSKCKAMGGNVPGLGRTQGSWLRAVCCASQSVQGVVGQQVLRAASRHQQQQDGGGFTAGMARHPGHVRILSECSWCGRVGKLS